MNSRPLHYTATMMQDNSLLLFYYFMSGSICNCVALSHVVLHRDLCFFFNFSLSCSLVVLLCLHACIGLACLSWCLMANNDYCNKYLEPDSSSHQEPSFCPGFSQSSKDLFVLANHLDSVMHYRSHCCR